MVFSGPDTLVEEHEDAGPLDEIAAMQERLDRKVDQIGLFHILDVYHTSSDSGEHHSAYPGSK